MASPDIAITSLETITAFDITSGEFLFMLDELQNASINQTQDVVDVTGKQGRLINRLKRNKAVTISGTNGFVSTGLLELQTGGEFATKETNVQWVDYLSISNNEATTSYKAVGTSGAEIEALYIRSSDGTLGTKLEQDSAASEGKFAYAPSTKKLTFLSSAYNDGTEIVVYYQRKINADVLVNESDKYSGKCSLYIDAIGEDKCSNIYRIQIYVPKADFNGEFTLDLGEDQTSHAFEANALAGSCGNSGNYWTYTVFGENASDVA